MSLPRAAWLLALAATDEARRVVRITVSTPLGSLRLDPESYEPGAPLRGGR